ncbi:sushi, von Willebrand factor type A, EGF and pentraxin domain-containing protein 1-like [Dreissena polymorpha]|uniref:sushi, von Willebrand factor type A, EGF and pentraxin domain-containing protein 1-like n=1 Tax=Dreissena polymorpha TaxID=45954 RepID=UPI00226404D9|nr:sushi, von Willebrand factor type A, EGF and pentraxin domain-containing protein 1-like [Dreissena polymorpha]
MCVGKPNTDNGESSVCACKPGYVQGNYILQCIPVNCGRPPDINNASVSVTSTSYGSLANYTCINADPHKVYESHMQLRCLGEGLWYQQWEQRRFYCLVKCNSTLEIANGSYTGKWRYYSYTSYAHRTTYYVGWEVEYVCNADSGQTRYTKCQLTGNWEPKAQCDQNSTAVV